jgi:protocatechuate 3,4-dioxygenase beta subunit
MKKCGFILFIFLLLSHRSFTQPINDKIQQLKNAFLRDPHDLMHYKGLSEMITVHYLDLTIEQRRGIRSFLQLHTTLSSININPTEEPGTKILIKGKIVDEKGVPIRNVKMHVFHTDASGYYAPDDKRKNTLNEPDARLGGYLVTDQQGSYSFQTVHPGTYPNKYEGRFIPQHIHFEIDHPGYQSYHVQMTMDDDPSMKEKYWQDWASKQKYPFIQMRIVNNIKTGVLDIRLVKQ